MHDDGERKLKTRKQVIELEDEVFTNYFFVFTSWAKQGSIAGLVTVWLSIVLE